MPRGVYERKNKKAKQPKPVNSTRSAAIKQGWARRKRKLKAEASKETDRVANRELAQLNGFISKKPASAKAPTEQQSLPLEKRAAEAPRHVIIIEEAIRDLEHVEHTIMHSVTKLAVMAVRFKLSKAL